KSKFEKFREIFGIIFKSFLIFILAFAFISTATVTDFSFPSHEANYSDWYGNIINLDIEDYKKENIAIIPINGMIINKNMGFLEGTTSETVLTMLHDVQMDETIQAVILQIDSPGGTVLDSEKIAEKITEVKKYKKVYALLESVAASGGYYIASQTDKIFSYKETLTGSIGVIMEIPNASKLMNTIGVDMISIHAGKNKTMGSPFSKLSDESRGIFQSLVDESYEGFIKRISDGRNMHIEDVRKIADGRVYSGIQALELGLLDSADGLSGLKEELKKEGLADANLIKFSLPRSPFEEILNPLGMSIQSFLPQKTSKVMMFYM
ncbi:signal peptide peptidase SppA, partial [Candidatus Peregrinibacteria bacterium]|nr:signal peptide peptidase SppA [Candidatus Peregrinibacteria bacterium]